VFSTLALVILVLSLLIGTGRAAITVYQANNQAAFFDSTGCEYTGVAAYNPTSLSPPPLPSPTNSGTPNLSIMQKGSFIGFSIEMSVTNQVLGKNSTLIQQRAGSVMVRVGGNTQESAKLVEDESHRRDGHDANTPLEFSRDLLYMMHNISSFVNVHWFLGIPWFVTQPFDTKIITASQEILGDYLLGLQAGNEPDMYHIHKHRNDSYSPFDYGGEISDLLTQVSATNADPSGKAMKLLIGPNIADFSWTPEQVWDSGFVDKFHNNLAYLAVEKYPSNNCAAMFGGPNAVVTDPQKILPLYLTHDAHTKLLAPYLNSTIYAQKVNKPFLMFETKHGFLALWGLDYALEMAHSNFSGAMFHLAPPTNQSTFHQWTVGPLYYSALVMAEAIGPSNNTQLIHNRSIISTRTELPSALQSSTTSNDPSGANTVHAVISLSGATMPASVKVKYLAATTVVQKGGYTWAGQTFGKNFESDGRPMGQEDIKTVDCDTTAKTCTVDVPAPGFALVFLNDDAFTEDKGAPSMTFPTTAHTRTHNTATVEPSVLATSNGFRKSIHELAGTSKPPSAAPRTAQSSLVALSVVVGAVVVMLGRAM
ncbi:glycoside hydrolase family 79 protein, partial [Mycena olivaceomarginata]